MQRDHDQIGRRFFYIIDGPHVLTAESFDGIQKTQKEGGDIRYIRELKQRRRWQQYKRRQKDQFASFQTFLDPLNLSNVGGFSWRDLRFFPRDFTRV